MRRARLALLASGLALSIWSNALAVETGVIDDPAEFAEEMPSWRFVADGVMGGLSTGSLKREEIADRSAVRLQGRVRLEKNGGFIQVALDLGIDASGWDGIELDVYGNGESYSVHLRTNDTLLPWQSYRMPILAQGAWKVIRLPFKSFKPHRLYVPLDVTRLERMGVVAIGRAFEADVAIGGARLYRE